MLHSANFQLSIPLAKCDHDDTWFGSNAVGAALHTYVAGGLACA